jgi:hypothetical protein
MFKTMEVIGSVYLAVFVLCNIVLVSATRSNLRNSRLLDEQSSCNVTVEFGECPAPEPVAIDNGCENPFQVITLRYNGGDCMQSHNLLERHEFTCDDTNGGPPTSSSTPNYITVTSRSGNETYFEGNVSIGDEYTLNADEEYSVLIGEMTISVYDTKGGNMLQKTNLLLDCTNELFLFDRFGASQVTSWKEINGREVKLPDPTTRTASIAVTVNNPDDSSSMRLVEMTLLGNMQEEAVDYTPEIKDVLLVPQQTLSLNPYQFQYKSGNGNRNRYTLFTTVVAESSNGSEECSDSAMLECVL